MAKIICQQGNKHSKHSAPNENFLSKVRSRLHVFGKTIIKKKKKKKKKMICKNTSEATLYHTNTQAACKTYYCEVGDI